MKGARHYRKSKRMKQKLARDHQRKHAPQQAARASILQQHLPPDPYAATAVALHGQASVCDAHKPCRRVRFASDTVEHRLLPEDDFLVMVIDGIDFLWATPTAHKSSPEALLESFLLHTNVNIGKIRIDDAGELSRSESFKLWCASRDIVICATACYNHTMQARAEGAVRITKEHVRCILKTAQMPHRFWPWALTHFCRIYNYWPTKGHAPPWVMLGDH
mmetsp:Transcript_62295/g.129224  ORF Transcript_62295/g.129224 Transcript_62295/m.129224 type:complete len:219 (-) Transcript_62295:1635-2291(-)